MHYVRCVERHDAHGGGRISPSSDTRQRVLPVIRCIRPNERCVDKSQTRWMDRDPLARGPCAVPARTYRSKARPRQNPIFKVQTTQMGLGYTQCIVTSRRTTRVREVSPETALISLSLPSKMRWRYPRATPVASKRIRQTAWADFQHFSAFQILTVAWVY